MRERHKDPARLNKTSICSVVFLDIVGYSKKPDSEQVKYKSRFNAFISEALKDVAQSDRIILDTGDGAAITLLGEPESALFISLTIRDGILESNLDNPDFPLDVRIGINLGPVQVVRDINNQLNIIGDGINVAQRVMSFSEPNQILVSRSYYEIVSRLSDDILKMFSYSGIKHDKHVREHEVYVIRTSDDVESSAELAARKHVDAQPETKASRPNKIMIAVGLALLAVIAVVAVTMERKNSPPAPSQIQPASPPPKAEQEPPAPSAKPGVKAVADTPKNIKKTKPAENRAPADRNPPAIEHQAKDEKKTGQNKFKGNMKQDANKFTCTDAQRSMNQCKDY